MSLYLAGSSVKAVAGELGLKVQHVGRLVGVRSVKRSRSDVARLAAGGPALLPPSEWPAEVLERWAAGESGEQIAESLGVKPGRVYRLLRRRGVLRSRVEARRKGEAPKPVRKVRELPAEVAEEAVERYLAGEPAGLVAAALQLPEKRVYRLLGERGVLRSVSEARKV